MYDTTSEAEIVLRLHGHWVGLRIYNGFVLQVNFKVYCAMSFLTLLASAIAGLIGYQWLLFQITKWKVSAQLYPYLDYFPRRI
jgi:hypothetical protein